MRIVIEIRVKTWKPWMRKFNTIFARGNRKVEIVILGYLDYFRSWILEKKVEKV